jgi:hypothetical protein
VFPRFFDLPQTDPSVGFKPPFATPEYKNIEFSFSAKPKVIDPVPTLLEELRAIRKEDKDYTDFLLRWTRDAVIEEMVVSFYSWLYGLYYDGFVRPMRKLGDFFNYLLSIFRQWLVFWLENIYLD